MKKNKADFCAFAGGAAALGNGDHAIRPRLLSSSTFSNQGRVVPSTGDPPLACVAGTTMMEELPSHTQTRTNDSSSAATPFLLFFYSSLREVRCVAEHSPCPLLQCPLIPWVSHISKVKEKREQR
jgi:hypothetical protein